MRQRRESKPNKTNDPNAVAPRHTKTWGERLSPEEQRVARENDPEYQGAQQEELKEELRRNLIIQTFRLGVKECCARAVWKKILKYKNVDKKSVSEQAQILGLSRQCVRNYNAGELSMVVMFALVSDLGLTLKKLDPLPPIRARVIAGYQRAIKAITSAEISIVDLLVVWSILSADSFKTIARSKQALDAKDWKKIAPAVTSRLEKLATDDDTVDLPLNSAGRAGRLAELHGRWSEAVQEVSETIPHRWIDEVT